MKKVNSNKTIFLLMVLSVLIVTVIAASYSFFTSLNPNALQGLNIGANIGASNSAFTAVGNNIELNITAINMEQANQNNTVATDTKNLTVSYLAGTTETLECTYDIYYKWDSNSDSYTITDANKKECTYEIPTVKSETNYVASSNTTPQKVNNTSLTISNASETVPTVQNYEITSRFYNIEADQTANSNKNWKLEFYVDNVVCGASNGVNLVTLLESKVASSDSVAAGTNGNLQKQNVTVTQNAALGINSSSYENIIYTGANPDNFIEFNGEMWRIIGVYNEDSHGIANTKLVKIIRNDNLIVSNADTSKATARWDYKYESVGSGSTNYGSNEWSDSQLMFMLNGETALNKAKRYDGAAYTYANTGVNGDYIQTRTNTGTYYTIWNKSNGHYLSYDANGDAISNKTIYTSSQATTSSYTAKTAVIGKTISRDAQEYIQEVTWHLGGYNGYTNTATYYEYERNNYEYNHTQTSETRSSLWTGKIGLMYPSDYGYATSGGSLGRNACLTTYQVGYASSNSWDQQSECYTNDWLLYPSSTITKGSAMNQWTILPYSSNASRVFYVNSDGRVNSSYAFNGNGVRPVLYLKADTMITDEGDGSYSNPYQLVE